MGVFLDRLLVQLSNPAEITALVAPDSDANRDRLRALISAAYDLPFATLHNVLDVQVAGTEFQRPLLPPGRTSGTWTQTTPTYQRTDVSYQSQDGLSPTWIDVVAAISMDLVLEVDGMPFSIYWLKSGCGHSLPSIPKTPQTVIATRFP